MVSPRAKAAIALVVGVGLLAALVAYVGPAKVAEALLSASPLHLALAAVTYGVFFLLRGYRWRTLLSRSAPDVRVSSTTSVTAVGWLANSILPFKGGDVLRAGLLAKREGLSAGHSVATVALERVLDLLGLATIAALGLLLLPRMEGLGWMTHAIELAWILPVAALVCLAVLVALREHAMRVSRACCKPLGKAGDKLHAFVETTVAGVDALARQPRLLLVLLPQTLLVALAQALIFTFLVMAFIPGTPLALAFGGSAIFLLSFVVSVTPGNVGTYEAAFGAVFAALGVPLAIAVPAAILTHLTTTLLVAVLGSLGMLALSMGGAKPALRPAKVLAGGGSP